MSTRVNLKEFKLVEGVAVPHGGCFKEFVDGLPDWTRMRAIRGAASGQH